MMSLILNTLPDRFRDLQTQRSEWLAKKEALSSKLDDHRAKTVAATAELRRLENEIDSTVAAAGDPGAQLKKLRAMRDAVRDFENVEIITEQVIEGAQNEISKLNVEMAAILQAATIRARNALGDQLQEKVDEIESAITAWAGAVFEAAERFGLGTPASGSEIVLRGLR